ncbi:MAG: DUF72 domain-containing protein [Acidobacteria bacterium]|nr:DUF72 domain-containing protein [Acidobacteriota bacterium]
MIWIGTSGYSYPEWKGNFYPADIPAAMMLPYYAQRFPTVEINNTFYRMPNEKVLSGWACATPEQFKLTLKAPRRITHERGLKDCADLVTVFCQVAGTLGNKLGVLLFQLPPSFKKDLVRLDEFLGMLQRGARVAIEFRHPSWHAEDVWGRLRGRNVALCIADSEKWTTPLEATADYGYLRLRDEGYVRSDIEGWAAVIRQRQALWQDTFVYFKHEEQGKGPEFAKMLQQMLDEVRAR